VAAPKRGSIEDRLARIQALRDEPPPDLATALRPFVADKAGVVVAFAAKVAGTRGLLALARDLEAAFFRFFESPVKTDPGCRGKLAIAEALRELDVHASDVFARGVAHRQPEPSYGPPLDTAGPLRVCCAGGLLQVRSPYALVEIGPLLADEEPNVRAGIAAVLGDLGSEAGEALLRLKAMSGDAEPDVTGACLQALLRSSFSRSFPFVVRAVERAAKEDDGALVQIGLLSLGESREAAAVAPLREHAETSADPDVRTAALLGLSLLRRPESDAYLLELVEHASEARAAEAVRALSSRLYDETLAARVRALAEQRGPHVRRVVDEAIARRGPA
jgi:hypothetical protein